MNDIYIGAYWGPRQESIAHCGDRLSACLDGLSKCDEAFAQWFEKGKSRKEALKKTLDFQNMAVVLQRLDNGRHKRDLDRSVTDELGFQIGLWNGRTSKFSASISISCGICTEHPYLINSVVLDLPEKLSGLSDKDLCENVLKVMADTWDPDWAGVISRKSRDARTLKPALFFVDWMFYINRIGIDLSKLPLGAKASKLKEGTLIIVQERPIDPSSHHELANLQAIEKLLGVTH